MRAKMASCQRLAVASLCSCSLTAPKPVQTPPAPVHARFWIPSRALGRCPAKAVSLHDATKCADCTVKEQASHARRCMLTCVSRGSIAPKLPILCTPPYGNTSTGRTWNETALGSARALSIRRAWFSGSRPVDVFTSSAYLDGSSSKCRLMPSTTSGVSSIARLCRKLFKNCSQICDLVGLGLRL